ncbi:taurine catabolism dioxygenase TauD/TfdA [Nostoc sp. 'Peltigera membranacea cyanobiont' N6]|nr:taurine catabolism dioxygenase TauD/TfdA [Nostoc sp. 'Peltigera membranacea cyanobiont' N6]
MNFKSGRRKPIIVSPEELIKTEFILPGQHLPLIIKPQVNDVNLIAWVANNRDWLETQLFKYGGILFRNFNIKVVTDFEQLIKSISGELIEYSYRSTPRSQVSGNIYTSTEYPAEESIPLHNEMAYARSWPKKICFFCVKAATEGGETPIVDSRKVFQQLDPKIKEQFILKKVMYVRNYGQGLDLQWQNVFQTTNKLEVESYCHHANIEFEWQDESNLKTRQVCQAIATHPRTGEMVWFNQAHLFHISNLKTAVRNSLLSVLKEEDLPRNALYGDGSRIETSVIEEINQIYQQESVTFSWQEGDILMLDNMLAAHGRKPFIGDRKVLVGMAEPYCAS